MEEFQIETTYNYSEFDKNPTPPTKDPESGYMNISSWEPYSSQSVLGVEIPVIITWWRRKIIKLHSPGY